KNKPVVIVTYAHRGGARASEHLKQVCLFIGMKPADTMPALVVTVDLKDESNRIVNPDVALEPSKESIEKATNEFLDIFKTLETPLQK
ncbi:hypothetical protein CYY_008769, partial [Polysphondylium violaceum]